MSKKIFQVEWCSSYSIMIQLDFSKDITGIFKEMNNFWDESEERLDSYDGDIIKVGLKMLAEKAFQLIIECNMGVSNLINRFQEQEGFCSVNGATGIEILDYTWCGLDDVDISITELKE